MRPWVVNRSLLNACKPYALRLHALCTGISSQRGDAMLKFLESLAYVGALALYLTPSIIADVRGRKDTLAVTIANVLLGWTIVGWFAALAWARHPVSDRKLTHMARKSRRAVARATIESIVARARRRSSLVHRPV